MTHKPEMIAQLKEVVDGNGRKIPIVAVGKSHFPLGFINYRIPNCDIAGHLKDIQNLSMRNDDVLLCAFMKSGTHWLWEIVQMLLRGNAEYETRTKLSAMIDIRTPEELDAIASPRVLNTHLPVDKLPSDVLSKRISIIHIIRNPKDVAVSLYHHISAMAPGGQPYPGGFQSFLPLFMDENNYLLYYWFDYILEYEQFRNRHRHFPILTIFYENLKKYPKEEILKIARFLGTKSDPHFIEEVVEKVEFHKLKLATEMLKDDDSAKDYIGGKSFIYRKGVVGDWRNWFSQEMNSQMNTLLRERLLKVEEHCLSNGPRTSIRGTNLLHDNASAYKSAVLTDFQKKHGICPLYISCLAPSYFGCFLSPKNRWKADFEKRQSVGNSLL